MYYFRHEIAEKIQKKLVPQVKQGISQEDAESLRESFEKKLKELRGEFGVSEEIPH